MSCFKAIFPCCFAPTESKDEVALENVDVMELPRNNQSPLRSIIKGHDGTVLHQPGKVGFIHSVLPENQFSPLLCSTKLVDEEKLKARSELEVRGSFHTGGTLSESFWKDIKRWDEKTDVVGNRESLLRRHSLASSDAKHVSANFNRTNEFNMTNVLPDCPYPVDLTQSNSTISYDSTVPSMADVGEKITKEEVQIEQHAETPQISDDEGGVYDVTSHEESFNSMKAKFTVGSMPNITEDSVATMTRKHSIDSNLSATGTHYTSVTSSRSRFTVAPVDEHLEGLQFKSDGSVQYKSPSEVLNRPARPGPALFQKFQAGPGRAGPGRAGWAGPGRLGPV